MLLLGSKCRVQSVGDFIIGTVSSSRFNHHHQWQQKERDTLSLPLPIKESSISFPFGWLTLIQIEFFLISIILLFFVYLSMIHFIKGCCQYWISSVNIERYWYWLIKNDSCFIIIMFISCQFSSPFLIIFLSRNHILTISRLFDQPINISTPQENWLRNNWIF